MWRFKASGFYLAMLALTVLAAYMVWGSNGYMVLVSLRNEEVQVLKENHSVMQKNQQIEKIIDRLKHDGTYIEHVAKHEFGLAGVDELIFRFDPGGSQ
ncbi:cell division protein FtsB [Desulfocicer vacuolatum DSM 3385]|uniref:Cell division protein FtsB n=1 Tax=Desulfocicer vacuolatum DSM 3385 TaxID=1121400 RepID=A0A1W2B8S7_9BACT|nr:septum formation initiator family protein [Desulfocicer vacuolatum]SMC69385.1 cell division protein FtsB [Desulfocicer vacuolatum DSM 3385]